MNSISVSVIIPCYNAASYVGECLESALCQTQDGMEIICVEDCSTDDSYNVLEAYAKRHASIRLYRNASNRGQSACRNIGLSLAQGDYIFFLDADDILPVPSALSVLYQAAMEDQADQVLGRILRWWPNSGVLKQDYHSLYQHTERRNIHIGNHPEFCRNVIACNKLIRRQFLEKHTLQFEEQLRKFEDVIFSCKIHILSQVTSYIKFTTYYHRKRVTGALSVTQNKNSMEYVYCYEIFKFYVEFFKNYPKYRYIYRLKAQEFLKSLFLSFSIFHRQEEDIVNLMRSLYALLGIAPHSFFPPAIRKFIYSLKNHDPVEIYQCIVFWYTDPALYTLHNKRSFSRCI